MIETLTVETLVKFYSFLLAPIYYPGLIFMIVPVLLMLIVIEYILLRNPEHAALPNFMYANDLIIIFAGINLLRAIGFPYMYDFTMHQTLIAYLIIVVGVTMIALDFLRVVPLFIGASISTKLVMNFAVYCAIAFVYSGMQFTATTFLSMIMLFFVIVAIINLVKVYES